MNSTASPPRVPPSLRRRLFPIGAVAIVLLLVYFALRPSKSDDASTAYHEVRRGDFTVSVIEPGTLTAVSEVIVRSEVEGTARIISIVPEGSYIQKGELLVELDSSQAQDQVNQQLIAVEKARFAVTNAEAQLEIQRSATNSDYLAAKLKLDLAIIDRNKYEQGQRLVDLLEAQNKALQASNQLVVNRETFSNSVILAEKGYETKQKVDGDRLAVLSNENQLMSATNSIWMLEAFTVEKNRKQYSSDVLQAQQELERVISQNRRKMIQYEADLVSQINTLKLSEDKLERDRKNLAATKILAPQEGLVVYQVSENRFSSESLIEGGAVVRNRQELIKLPDLSRMKVIVKIHESHINMIRPGLPAFVVLDSDPDQRYVGSVQRVAPLPDTQARWGNPNLKVYNTEVHLTENPPNVKPGVSTKAEIIITNIANVLSVPIQAVTTFKGKQVVYLVSGGKTEPKQVEVGMFNTKFIQITEGLKEGDRVLLSPPFDTQERDLEGAVLAADEKAKVQVTNLPPPAAVAPNGVSGLAGPGGGSGLAATPPNGAGNNTPGGRPGQGRRGGFNPEEMLKQYDKNGDGQLDETEREAMRATMAERFGGQGPPGGGAGGGPRFNREEMLKQYDKNGDGELDDTEREAMRSALRAQFGDQAGGAGGGPRLSREEMLKRFDKNGDGELDDSERAAMREAGGAPRANRGERAGEGGGESPRPRREDASPPRP